MKVTNITYKTLQSDFFIQPLFPLVILMFIHSPIVSKISILLPECKENKLVLFDVGALFTTIDEVKIIASFLVILL